jgi:hypothetical protein
MGGDIAVTSEPGKGSFTVRLPANVTHLAERPESAQTGSGNRPGHRRRAGRAI